MQPNSGVRPRRLLGGSSRPAPSKRVPNLAWADGSPSEHLDPAPFPQKPPGRRPYKGLSGQPRRLEPFACVPPRRLGMSAHGQSRPPRLCRRPAAGPRDLSRDRSLRAALRFHWAGRGVRLQRGWSCSETGHGTSSGSFPALCRLVRGNPAQAVDENRRPARATLRFPEALRAGESPFFSDGDEVHTGLRPSTRVLSFVADDADGFRLSGFRSGCKQKRTVSPPFFARDVPPAPTRTKPGVLSPGR